MENKYNIDDILSAIVDEKPVDLQAAVNSLMVDKAHDTIASLKAQIMQDMYDGQVEDEEEVEDEPEDDAEEASDEVEELDTDELFNDEEETEQAQG